MNRLALGQAFLRVILYHSLSSPCLSASSYRSYEEDNLAKHGNLQITYSFSDNWFNGREVYFYFYFYKFYEPAIYNT